MSPSIQLPSFSCGKIFPNFKYVICSKILKFSCRVYCTSVLQVYIIYMNLVIHGLIPLLLLLVLNILVYKQLRQATPPPPSYLYSSGI